LAILGLLGSGTAAVAAATAQPAAANAKSNWSATIPTTHITYGWTKDHAWVIADYRDLAAKGVGQVASYACGAALVGTGIGLFLAFAAKQACDWAFDLEVGYLLRNQKLVTNHGIWAGIYPFRLSAWMIPSWSWWLSRALTYGRY
jgi:hypothetical protein